MSTLMYRLRVKNTLLNSLNTNNVQNQLITMINGSKSLIVGTGDRARGYILMNTYLLGDQASDYFLIDVFGTTYRITKNTIHKYYNNQYVWYGDIYTLDGSKKVGIANFIVNDTTVVEGTIRPFGDAKPSYFLAPNTAPYYIIKQIIPIQPGYTTVNTTVTTSTETTISTGSTVSTGTTVTTTGSVTTSTGSVTTGSTTT